MSNGETLGEVGCSYDVIRAATRYIDPKLASDEDLENALTDCYIWRASYPETDDYPLVDWLDATCRSEQLSRSLAKICGGIKPEV